MHRLATILMMILCGAHLSAVGQEAVVGIPSMVDVVESNGRGIVCAMTDANRVYLSRDGGAHFQAVDTAEIMLEPWLSNQRWIQGTPPVVHFDRKNDYLWVRSQKDYVLCRHNLRTGEWSAPIPFEAPYTPPTWYAQAIASGTEGTVVVGIGGYDEVLGEKNYILRSFDAGDTWHRLPDIDSTGQLTNSIIESLAVMPDGSVLASTGRYFSGVAAGIYRLASGDSVWKSIFPTRDRYKLLLAGDVVYASNRTKAWFSDDFGLTFSPIDLGDVKALSVRPYRGDTAAFILSNTEPSVRNTRVFAVVKGDIVGTLHDSIRHAHVTPFVSTIADSLNPRLVISGNGVTGTHRPGRTTVDRMRFSPETYACFWMCRVTTGLVVYVRGQGYYRIGPDGSAVFDTSTTYQLRREPQDMWSSNDDGLILNHGLTYLYVAGTRIDTIIPNPPGPGIVRYPVLVHDSVVYAGLGRQGVETFHLSDTARRRLLNDGMPAIDENPQSYDVGSAPIRFNGSRLVVLLYGVLPYQPRKVSPDGGVYTIEDGRWERVNDTALGTYRVLFSNGDCHDGICAFNAYERGPSGYSRVFSYTEATNTVELVSAGGGAVGFREASVVDNDHIAMTGLHDTVRVVERSTQRTLSAVVGVPLEVSALNGKVAVSTLRDGILLYPLNALTSVYPTAFTRTPSLEAWYDEDSRHIHLAFDHETGSNTRFVVTDLLGNVVAAGGAGLHQRDDVFSINASTLASGYYVVVVIDPQFTTASAPVVVRN